MDLFDPAHPSSHRLKVLPVRERYYNSDEAYELIHEVYTVVSALEHYGAYLEHEIPLEIRLSCRVYNYKCEVDNGGHEQFVSNSRWTPQIQAEVEQGLGIMGAHVFQALFREVADYINSDPEVQKGVMKRCGFDHEVHGRIDPWIRQKDREFFALVRQADFFGHHANWLRSLDCIQPVADRQWKHEMVRAIEAQTTRVARQTAKGLRKDDFLADIRARLPLCKPMEDYAQELGARCNIDLNREPTRSWRTWDQETPTWWFVFRARRRSLLAGFRYPYYLAQADLGTERMKLYRLADAGDKDAIGIVGPALGQLKMERQED